ncbi:MAG: hypothetical protein M1821_005789 [Bathelium mastoideum]|nr:MAG: hypothetical protein M1821_005789 [Bathelium mastoideum]
MPTYTTHECTDLATFRSIVRAIWTANHHPYQPYFSAYNPVFGPTPADRNAAIESSCQRKWATHLATPASHWIYVLDEEIGEVVGATEWRLYEESPYAGERGLEGGLPYEASAWPEGSVGREFVKMMLKRQYGHRRRWLDRRHAALYSMSVLPFHRLRGVGHRLMSWGMSRAASLKLEVFTHATSEGRWLYEKFGLRVLNKFELDMNVANPSDEWEKLRHDLGPLSFWVMWKPVEGVYEEGSPLPWEKVDFEV